MTLFLLLAVNRRFVARRRPDCSQEAIRWRRLIRSSRALENWRVQEYFHYRGDEEHNWLFERQVKIKFSVRLSKSLDEMPT